MLYSFSNGSTGGVGLEGDLVLDAAGNVYGTAYWGGSDFQGTVFELTHGSSGWTEKDHLCLLPVSGCGDGGSPASGVIFDDAGNLYGTATAGGADGGGVIFKLVPSNGSWTESVLYSFCTYNFCGRRMVSLGINQNCERRPSTVRPPTAAILSGRAFPAMAAEPSSNSILSPATTPPCIALMDATAPSPIPPWSWTGRTMSTARPSTTALLDAARSSSCPPSTRAAGHTTCSTTSARRERGIDGHRFGRKSVRRQCRD